MAARKSARRKSTRRKSTAVKKQAPRKSAARKSGPAGKSSGHRWSGRVTRESDALDLEQSVFKSSDPHKIAKSLKRSAEKSHRRKSSPFRSAMSMLTFYINRAGTNLSARHRKTLTQAKDALRVEFGEKPSGANNKPPKHGQRRKHR
jgi:hypothetical protein